MNRRWTDQVAGLFVPSAKDRFRAKLLPSERNLVQKAALWAAKVVRAKPVMIFLPNGHAARAFAA